MVSCLILEPMIQAGSATYFNFVNKNKQNDITSALAGEERKRIKDHRAREKLASEGKIAIYY